MPIRELLVLAPLALVACVAEPPDLSAISPALNCSGFGCPDNSPIVGGYEISELHAGGQPNRAGVRIASFHAADGRSFRLAVQGARLVGLDRGGNVALDTPGMSGARIGVTNQSGEYYEIVVADIHALSYWVPPHDPVTTYYFRVRRRGDGPLSNMCPRPPNATDWPGDVLHAIVFERDRYDPTSKTVTVDGADWFNIACAGTATAKMHFVRYTEVGQHPDLPALPVPRRQAMLKMFTAAYCPPLPDESEVAVYTVMGEPLRYRDSLGVVDLFDRAGTPEAVWGPDGAICLDTPRLENATRIPQDEAKRILSDLDAQCGGRRPPSCASVIRGFPLGWQQAGFVLSANRDDS